MSRRIVALVAICAAAVLPARVHAQGFGPPPLPTEDPIHEVLEGVEGLPPPADEKASAVAAHLQQHAPGIQASSRVDGTRDAKAREDTL